MLDMKTSIRGFWFRSGFWQCLVVGLCGALTLLVVYATWLNVEIADLRDRVSTIEKQSESFHDRQPQQNFEPASIEAKK